MKPSGKVIWDWPTPEKGKVMTFRQQLPDPTMSMSGDPKNCRLTMFPSYAEDYLLCLETSGESLSLEAFTITC